MNEEDEFISVRRLRSTLTSLKSWDLASDSERLSLNSRLHSMTDDASRFELRWMGQISETACSHRIRKRIRPDIVWQVAYGVRLMHPEVLAACARSSNHSEHMVVGSFPMTPYTR